MKHLLLVALVAASFSSLANANNGVYFSIKAGVSDTKFKDSGYGDTTSDIYSDNYHYYLTNDENESTYPIISAAIGYDFSSISPVNARAELEYTYKGKSTYTPDSYGLIYEGRYIEEFNKSTYKNELTTQSLMLNGYYDFKNTSKFTPYVSAGVGFTHVKNKVTDFWASRSQYDSDSDSDSDSNFTWSAGVGVNYAVSKNVGLDLSYRYVDAGKFKFYTAPFDFNQVTKAKLVSNEYLLGIRYNF